MHKLLQTIETIAENLRVKKSCTLKGHERKRRGYVRHDTIMRELIEKHPALYSRFASIIDPRTSNLPQQEFLLKCKTLLRGTPYCKTCGGLVIQNRIRVAEPWPDYCSPKCMSNSPSVLSKREATCMERYGVHASMLNVSIRRKIEATCLKRYGTIHGVASRIARAKTRSTMLLRYGVEHHTQNTRWNHEKGGQQFRRTTLRIRGTTYTNLQGYESRAIVWLLKKGFEIVAGAGIKAVPRIWYHDRSGRHAYFADLVAKKNGRTYFIEVKSGYTAGVTRNLEYQRMKIKGVATEASGRRFVLLVFRKRGDPVHFVGVPSRKELRSRIIAA